VALREVINSKAYAVEGFGEAKPPQTSRLAGDRVTRVNVGGEEKGNLSLASLRHSLAARKMIAQFAKIASPKRAYIARLYAAIADWYAAKSNFKIPLFWA
jgi:hypothetical protein